MPSDSQTTQIAPCAPQEALSRPPPLSMDPKTLNAPSSPPVISSALLVAYLAGLCLGLTVLQLTQRHDRQDDPNP